MANDTKLSSVLPLIINLLWCSYIIRYGKPLTSSSPTLVFIYGDLEYSDQAIRKHYFYKTLNAIDTLRRNIS